MRGNLETGKLAKPEGRNPEYWKTGKLENCGQRGREQIEKSGNWEDRKPVEAEKPENVVHRERESYERREIESTEGGSRVKSGELSSKNLSSTTVR